MPFRPSTAIGPMDTWTRRTYPRSNNEARTRVQEKCSGCPTSDRRRNVLNARLADAWLMRILAWSCASAIATALPLHNGMAEELTICSAATARSGGVQGICEVTPLSGGGNKIKLNLTAQTGKIVVGGYGVETEHYNASYLAPVIEAMPGDTVAARLVNRLEPRTPSDGHAGHGAPNENPTNLHYFHGGIVTPKNARPPEDAGKGNGDNIFVYLKNGKGSDETGFSFEYEVPIPGKDGLDARVLEADGSIEHPSGLNWYHSHLHGRSSDQVMGGLSGLLSVGDAKANVAAVCRDPANPDQCRNATADLQARTDVRYALLRDIALKNISALPEAAGDKTATWAPEDKDWTEELRECRVWLTPGGSPEPRPSFRKGYCQRDPSRAWLFTVNGERFPTITVANGRNLLLRLGNLSPNVAYWLELYNEADETDKLPLTLLSIDGVVPAKPVNEAGAAQPVAAFPVPDFLFMPASRAEIYVRNDIEHAKPKVYILRTKGLIAGIANSTSDRWPEIQLARIVLEPTGVTSPAEVALNAVVAKPRLSAFVAPALKLSQLPPGCVADIDPAKGEHRRVTFFDFGMTSNGEETKWSILTEIVQPPPGTSGGAPALEQNFKPDLSKTVGITDPNDGSIGPIPFEEYDLGGGAIDWSNPKKPHVCVHIDSNDRLHKGSHKQLWVLFNKTSALHNFHIHQMKFRLATPDELKTVHNISLVGESSHTCPDAPAPCNDPDYSLYDDGTAGPVTKWHDTIPIPPGKRVYIIMSFDASQQVGRFVFHCHILKHEDNGLMAPIEVWTEP